ncbi:MAG TPA: hypothetical protein VF026_06270 [Ktedonobacteraceae bacterium]
MGNLSVLLASVLMMRNASQTSPREDDLSPRWKLDVYRAACGV